MDTTPPAASQVTILLIEDNREHARFLKGLLGSSSFPKYEVVAANSLAEGIEILHSQAVDLVILDLSLPDSRCLATFEKFSAESNGVPIVVLSGHADEDFAVEILNRGAQDYLVKWEGDGRIILRAIRYAIERKRAEIKVNYLARLDWPTCLPNRQYLRDELAHAVTRAVRSRRSMALLVLDVDGIQTVNETLGRSLGDAGRQLQQQGRLAYSRVTAEQGDRAGHEASAQDAIHLADARREARRLRRFDRADGRHHGGARHGLCRAGPTRRFRAWGGRGLHQCIPRAAGWTLPCPLRRRGAALLAQEGGLHDWHAA